MKVLALNGSPRRDGNTFQALGLAAEELEQAGIQVETVQVGSQKLSGCIACEACKKGEKAGCVFGDGKYHEAAEKMYAADGLLVGSPIYYAAINGTLKSFLDRAFYSSRGRMRHKVGASVLVPRRTGGMPGLEQINNYFLISEMIVASSYYWPVIHGREKGEVLKDTEGVSTIRNLGRNMAWILNMQEQTRDTLPPPQPVKQDRMHFIR